MAERSKIDVFITYAAHDADLAAALSEELERRGLQVWYSSGKLRSGEPWLRKMEDALDSAGSCVVLFSQEALDSPNVTLELGFALGQSKKVVPVFLSREARRNAPAFLGEVHGILAEGKSAKVIAEKVAEALQASAAA
jgi:hypothetical protein